MTFSEQVEIMREGGTILTSVLKILKEKIEPGVKASELDALAEKLILEAGAKPAFKNYHPNFCKEPYPYSLCVSINEIVVHGLSSENLIIKDGDIVSLDLGVKFKNYFVYFFLFIYHWSL